MYMYKNVLYQNLLGVYLKLVVVISDLDCSYCYNYDLTLAEEVEPSTLPNFSTSVG